MVLIVNSPCRTHDNKLTMIIFNQDGVPTEKLLWVHRSLLFSWKHTKIVNRNRSIGWRMSKKCFRYILALVKPLHMSQTIIKAYFSTHSYTIIDEVRRDRWKFSNKRRDIVQNFHEQDLFCIIFFWNFPSQEKNWRSRLRERSWEKCSS
jgi:hypothetical protein